MLAHIGEAFRLDRFQLIPETDFTMVTNLDLLVDSDLMVQLERGAPRVDEPEPAHPRLLARGEGPGGLNICLVAQQFGQSNSYMPIEW